MREFVGIDLAWEQVWDVTTLLMFRRLLEDRPASRPPAAGVDRSSGETG